MVKKWGKKQSCWKLPEMARKLIENFAYIFDQNFVELVSKFGQRLERKSCSKLPEMARKLIVNVF